MTARILDDINEFFHEKFIPEKKVKPKRSREQRTSRRITYLMVVVLLGGAALSVTLAFMYSSAYALLLVPVVLGSYLIAYFNDWYDNKYHVRRRR